MRWKFRLPTRGFWWNLVIVMCHVVVYDLDYSTFVYEPTVQVSYSINLPEIKTFILSFTMIQVLDLSGLAAYTI